MRQPKPVDINGTSYTVMPWTWRQRQDFWEECSQREKDGKKLPITQTVLKYAGDSDGKKLFADLEAVESADGLLVEYLFEHITQYNRFTSITIEEAKKKSQKETPSMTPTSTSD